MKDSDIRRTFKRCGINIVEPDAVTRLHGTIGSFRVHRGHSYYWIVDGQIPIDMARELYAHPVGVTDIRVAGHCGCPAPELPWVNCFDADGVELAHDPSGEEEKTYRGFVERGHIKPELRPVRFVPDALAAAARIIVDGYHIDSELGLYVFAEAVRARQTGGAP